MARLSCMFPCIRMGGVLPVDFEGEFRTEVILGASNNVDSPVPPGSGTVGRRAVVHPHCIPDCYWMYCLCVVVIFDILLPQKPVEEKWIGKYCRWNLIVWCVFPSIRS